MEVRKLSTLAERLDAMKISSIAFVGTLDLAKAEQELQEEMKKDDGGVDYYGTFDEDGRMTSHMINNVFHILYDGRIVQMGGIGNVSSLPEFRRKGGIRDIFRVVFEDMRARGFVFSALYPFSHPYYRMFGYEFCHAPLKQRALIADLKKFPCPYSVRMHEQGECIQPFKDVYQRFILGKNMGIIRSDSQWDIIKGEIFKDRTYRYLFSDDTGVHGYICFRSEGMGEERAATIRDIAYDSPEALHGILGFMYRLSAQYKYLEGHFPPDVDLRTLIDEPYGVTQTVDTRGMYRVMDVSKALLLMRHPRQAGSYTIEVKDDFIPENTGVYAVKFADCAAISVDKTDAGDADITVSVQTLAQMVLGFHDLSSLLYRPDVVRRGNAETLSAVFIRKDCYFNDYF